MSERVMRGWRAALSGGLLATALLIGPAAARADCAPLSANFVLCAQGTLWAGAEWAQFGDGASLELGGYYLEFSEQWVTRKADTTLDVALDVFVAELDDEDRAEGLTPPVTLSRDQFETGTLRVVRVVQNIEPDDDTPLYVAVMLAEGGGERIALTFGHEVLADLEALDREARALVALIHPAQGR